MRSRSSGRGNCRHNLTSPRVWVIAKRLTSLNPEEGSRHGQRHQAPRSGAPDSGAENPIQPSLLKLPALADAVVKFSDEEASFPWLPSLPTARPGPDSCPLEEGC